MDYTKFKLYRPQNIQQNDVICYNAKQPNNMTQPVKYRNFLVKAIDNDELTLVPITHSGPNPDKTKKSKAEIKKLNQNPLAMYNVKFPELMQNTLNKATGENETSYFNTVQMFKINKSELANTKLYYVTSFANFPAELKFISKEIHDEKCKIVDNNCDYINKTKNSYYTLDRVIKKEKAGEWITNETIKKMNIAPEIIFEQPQYPQTMHPIKNLNLQYSKPQTEQEFEL